MYIPQGGGNKHAILVVHGGGITGDKVDMSQIAIGLANLGYVVFNINYDLASAGPPTNIYPTAVNDIGLAAAWMQTHAATYQIDSTKISAFGVSAGANLISSLTSSSSVKALSLFYSISDFTDATFLSNMNGGQTNGQICTIYFGVSYAGNPTLYASASPLFNVSGSNLPTSLWHGTADAIVPYSESVNMYNALQAIPITSNLYPQTGLGHGFLTNGTVPVQPYLQQVNIWLQSLGL